MKKILIVYFLILMSILLISCQASTSEPAATLAPTSVPPSDTVVEEPTEEVVSQAETTDPTALTANTWKWVSFTNPVEQYEVEIPQNYLLRFNDDATVNIKADCNNAMGNFSLDDGSIKIEVGPMTRAMCPPESLSEDFVKYLGSAAIFFFNEGDLFIDLFADGGTMTFSPTSEELLAIEEEGEMIGELPEDIVAQLDAFLQSQVYTDGGNPELAAPGLVVYVETPDGRYLNAAGVANLEDGTPMQVEDILQIGSNTKSMTIVLLMQLVEEGLISLDDPLSQWLPEQATILPNGDQVTIRQMAQHTAGLYDYGDNIIAAGVNSTEALKASFTPEELVQDAVDNGTPYFAPGEEGQWHYSNTGYILLGMIIEQITGEAISDLMQMKIFDPLKMSSAVFIESVPKSGEITTHGYWWEENQRIDTTEWNASQGWVAGAAAMTAEDLGVYGKALASGEFFQSPATLQEMLTWEQAAKFSVGGAYGLGLLDFSGDGSVWGHAGQTLGFQSLWYTNPETGLVVVGLTNSATYKADAFLNVLQILEGEGALPISPFTLLPVGNLVPTEWRWVRFTSPVEVIDMDEETGLILNISKDQSVIVKTPDCGIAAGTYTVDDTWSINFEIDAATLACEADSQAVQLVGYLNDAAKWHFDNGQLIIELPVDGGSMIFDMVPLE